MYQLVVILSALLMVFSTYANDDEKLEHRSEEGKVKISFPIEYKSSEEETDFFKKVTLVAKDERNTYKLIYTIHTEFMKEFLTDGYSYCERTFKALTSSLGETIKEQDYEYQGIKGKKAKVKVSNGKGIAYCRSIYKDMILYQIVSITPSMEADSASIAFFNSFKILE